MSASKPQTAPIDEACEVIDFIMQKGLKPEIRNGTLYVGPKDKLDDELRELIRDHAAGMMAFLTVGDYEVQWRAARMLEQLLPLSWPCPIPTLAAVLDAEIGPNRCHSCGELDATGEGTTYICGACSRAKDAALSLWMERPASAQKVA